MPITVYGAGAIGGITGAALARAGHDVLLVDSAAAHVDAINASGLTVERDGAATVTRVPAVTPGKLGLGLSTVLLAVKSHHTADALAEVAPRLAPDGVIVSLQNGLSEERIAETVGAARTVGCLVNWAADWVGPGRIRHGGRGAFVLGELDGRRTARVEELARLLAVVEPTQVTDNVLGYKWSKVVYASLLFATAVVDAHVYEVVERGGGVPEALCALVGEGLAVADKAGIRIDAFDEFDPALFRAALAGDGHALRRAMGMTAEHYRANAKTKTGVWRDLAVRRRKTEVDGLVGVLAAKGEALGVAMPLTRRLIDIIHDLEEGRRPMGWANLDPLVSAERPREGAR